MTSTGETAPAAPAEKRVDSIDLLRGIVMAVMLLDHTRDMIHGASFQFSPTDLDHTTVAIFFTRWITHFCAPVFVFLAGTAVYMQAQRGDSPRDLTRFLLTRGLWLVLLELTVVRIGAILDFDYRVIGPLQVIWAIGVSMLVMAAVVRLPFWAIVAFGLVGIFGHDLLDSIHVEGTSGPAWHADDVGSFLWIVLHQGGLTRLGPGPVEIVLYPLLPWPCVMAAGYGFGRLFRRDPAHRRRRLVWLGLGITLLFVALRAWSGYGDPSPFTPQDTTALTVLSFLNTSKYPPSLQYLAMTLGPAIALLGLLDGAGPGPLARPFVLLGRVPLFFYLLQWPTARWLGALLTTLAGKSAGYFFIGLDIFRFHPPPGTGFPLWVVYAQWLVGLALLYPLCRWFAGVKRRRSEWWLRYL